MRLFICLVLGLCLLALPVEKVQAQKRERVACTCLPADMDTRITQADRIYTGTVRSIETADSMVQPGRKDPPVIVTFDVQDSFKDADSRPQVLHTSLTRVTCAGYPFEEGKTYLIYAYKRLASTYERWSLYDYKTGTLDTGGLCGGTIEASDDRAVSEIAKLRVLKASNDSRLLPRKPEL